MPDLLTPISTLIVWAAIGYMIGSIPFGVIVSRALGLGDLRKIGSGNIGATNVLRTGSKGAAVATLLLDGGKGAVAVLLAASLASEDAMQVAGLAAFLGHCFPIWLRFRGGKGVATFLGILLAASWPVGVAACGTWLAVAVASRYSSLAALMAAGSAPFWSVFLGSGNMFVLCIALAVLIYIRHGSNIRRLRAGTETRIGERSS